MFIFSRMHCVCKQKQIYFFPFGARTTDVLVFCVLYFPQMQHTEELCVYIGTVSGGKDGRRYIPIHDLCSSLSNITCQILLSLHALTGCDTTSAFVRIGKIICLQNLENINWRIVWFSFTEQCWSWNYNIYAARHALSLLYDPKGKFKSCHHDLYMLRVKLATSKDASLSRIPPSEPSFKQQFG